MTYYIIRKFEKLDNVGINETDDISEILSTMAERGIQEIFESTDDYELKITVKNRKAFISYKDLVIRVGK